jgi:hypothetical protein
MVKATAEALLDEISDDFHTYLRKGVRFDQVIGSAHDELNIDDIETLLRIHFVLTDAEEGDGTRSNGDVGVLDFVRRLERRIRRMKTTTAPLSSEHRGEARGRINWSKTVRTRARTGKLDEPTFVCDRPEIRYDIDENLVLKRLLSVVHDIVIDDLAYARDNPDDYAWLDTWTDPTRTGTSRNRESLVDVLDRLYQQNVYLQRIDLDTSDITARTVESVKRSRSRFYSDAAVLLDRYRQLMNHDLNSADAREILNHTIVAPEKTAVLFELYWIFRILNQYEGVQYRVLADSRDDLSTVASWEQNGSRFVLSHDATGKALRFNESVESADLDSDGYLYRMNEVLARWQSLSAEALGRGGSDTLWGGRPDIVLEQYRERSEDDWKLDRVFVGEVKYTQNIDYVATGLRELLEYMAFVKHESTDEYVEQTENVLNSVRVTGALFVDELDQETASPPGENIEIVQYGDKTDQVL